MHEREKQEERRPAAKRQAPDRTTRRGCVSERVLRLVAVKVRLALFGVLLGRERDLDGGILSPGPFEDPP